MHTPVPIVLRLGRNGCLSSWVFFAHNHWLPNSLSVSVLISEGKKKEDILNFSNLIRKMLQKPHRTLKSDPKHINFIRWQYIAITTDLQTSSQKVSKNFHKLNHPIFIPCAYPSEPLVEVVVKQWVLHASSTVMHSISMTSQAMWVILKIILFADWVHPSKGLHYSEEQNKIVLRLFLFIDIFIIYKLVC